MDLENTLKKSLFKNKIKILNQMVAYDNSNLAPKNKGVDFKKVEKSIKECFAHVKIVDTSKEKSLSIILEGVRLVSLNEIFATLQIRKYEIFKYKKLWHNTITSIIKNYEGKFPVFKNEKIKITYFRQSPRFLDHDSLIPSFKFFLDAIVENGIIDDDNPNIVEDMKPIQQKGQELLLGLKIEKIEHPISQPINIFEEWGFKEKMIDDEIDERF